jgi:hypothetical protein
MEEKNTKEILLGKIEQNSLNLESLKQKRENIDKTIEILERKIENQKFTLRNLK